MRVLSPNILKKSERIECIINAYFNGNKSRFAKLLGVKPQTINTWITRGTFDIERVYTCCTQLNPHWLLTGEGEMLKAPPAEQSVVVGDLTHVEGPTKPEPADTAVLRARLAAAEDLVQALRAQLMEKEQTAAALRQIIEEKQKLINLLEAR